MSGNSQVRTTAVLCLLCVIALTVAFPVQAQAQPQAETPDAVVSPGESIQNAIDTASPGETIQLNSGTYEQGIVIDKNLNIVASGDVTLNGAGVSAEDGIVVETTNVTIDGIEIAQFSDDGIDVRGDNLDPRQIEIVNVTSRLNGGNNIVIFSSQAEDTVELTNVVSRNSGNLPEGAESGDGILIFSETVIINNTTSTESEDVGLDIFAGEEGTVSIRQSTVSDNGIDNFEDDAEDGIRINSAQQITVENTTTTGNLGGGIEVSASDAITGGRTVEVANVTSRLNQQQNIFIGATADADRAELTNVVSRNSGIPDDGSGLGEGILISSETVIINNTTSTGSEDVGLNIFAGEEGTVSIRQSTVSDNGIDNFEDDAEDGIRINSAQQITVENTTTTGNLGGGIEVSTSDATTGGRTVEVANVTSRLNQQQNIFIGATADADRAELTNVVSRNSGIPDDGSGLGEGILISSETVIINNTTSTGSEDVGLNIFAGEEGTVSIRQSTVSDNGIDNFEDDAEAGIRINSAQQITVENTTTTGNLQNGLEVSTSDATTGGRTMNFTDVTSRANGFNGAFIGGTADADAVSIANSRFDQNDDDGLETQVESVNIAQTNLTRNTLAGARVGGAFTGGTLTQSSIFNNGGPAILNAVSGTSVDATNNWWGNPSGPGTNEIAGSGNVDATDPLPAPPDPDTDSTPVTDPFPEGEELPGVGSGAGQAPTDPDDDGEFEDIDGDGEKTFEDAIALAFANPSQLTEKQVEAVDFDGDGNVDFNDAIELAFQA